jgi:hypothetical protein
MWVKDPKYDIYINMDKAVKVAALGENRTRIYLDNGDQENIDVPLSKLIGMVVESKREKEVGR